MIHIMVLSSMKPPYDELLKAQMETWDSRKVEGVNTHYYFGDKYELMHVPFKETLKVLLTQPFDFIFRTNSSSYVNKNKLKEFLSDKPKTGVFIGNGDGVMSGAGFIISKDIAQIVCDKLTDEPHPYEDQLIAGIIESSGVKCQVGQRTHYYPDRDLVPAYSYRCKEGEDRNWDIRAMHDLFNRGL